MEVRKRTRREDRPEVILDAAEAVMRRSGAPALTMDAVALEAGLSKGGVLHHFGSKDALICALAARKLKRLQDGIARHAADQAPGPAAAALAMVANARETYGEEEGFPRALLFASLEHPEALDGFRRFLAERLDQMTEKEGRCGAGSALVFAIIGLMVGRTLGLHDLPMDRTERIFDALEAAARTLGDP